MTIGDESNFKGLLLKKRRLLDVHGPLLIWFLHGIPKFVMNTLTSSKHNGKYCVVPKQILVPLEILYAHAITANNSETLAHPCTNNQT